MGCLDYNKEKFLGGLTALATILLITACGGDDEQVIRVISQPTEAGDYFDTHFPGQ